jgi:hypothetical protein
MVEAASSYPLANAIWTMFVFFAWIIWIWMLFMIFTDLFRRSDLSGWGKAVWTLFVLVVPFIGVFVYLIVQGRQMAERRATEAHDAQQQFDAHVRAVAGSDGQGGAAGQISQAKALLDSGAIDQGEYEKLKQKALA